MQCGVAAVSINASTDAKAGSFHRCGFWYMGHQEREGIMAGTRQGKRKAWELLEGSGPAMSQGVVRFDAATKPISQVLRQTSSFRQDRTMYP